MKQLAALVQPHKKAVDPATYPKPPHTNENGYSIQWHWCDKHSTEYLKTQVPGWTIAMGQCEQCAAEERLERKARELLPSRAADLRRKIEERMAEQEQRIAQQTEERLAALVVRMRPQIEQDVSAEIGWWERAAAEVELVAQIKDELRAGKTEATATAGGKGE